MNYQLSDSEERFRALVMATSDVVYKMNADWSVMTQLVGSGFLTDSGPMTNWADAYIFEEDIALVKETVKNAIANKSMYQLEHRVLQSDGSVGWTSSYALPILDDEGEIKEWFGAANNITDRKKTEEDLRIAKENAEQQKRLYEVMTSSTPDLVYVFDLDYKFTFVNQALLTMWGKTWETGVGKTLLENGYEPWHAAMHEREIDTVVATKKSIRGEVSFPHAVLGKRIYDYIFTPVINDFGAVEAVAGTTRDITEIKQAELVLSESEARFRNMAEGANIYISMSDENGKMVYFNQAWANLTGRSASDLVNIGWKDLVHPDDLESYLKHFESANATRRPVHYSFRVRTVNGDYKWLIIDSSVRLNTDGSYAGYISAGADITELKEDEQRKNDFISMVSHELKTPLTSALGNIQVSKTISEEHPENINLFLDRAEKQLRKMTTMINGFLNVSRFESGKIQIDFKEFEMGQLLAELEEEVLSYFGSHHFIFKMNTNLTVVADYEKIGQVIQNFVSNAVKYSPPGSTIEVLCLKQDNLIKLSVKDEGIGINAADLPHLFERFYRAGDTKVRNVAGFGIGLYLSAEIILRHGGKIWAESIVDAGSTFSFSLPAS